MIKAALGGGGKGMRVAETAEEFEQNFRLAQTEARQAFGDDSMYIEHFMHASAAYRISDPGRQLRQCDSSGRAGLLYPAEPPEDD